MDPQLGDDTRRRELDLRRSRNLFDRTAHAEERDHAPRGHDHSEKDREDGDEAKNGFCCLSLHGDLWVRGGSDNPAALDAGAWTSDAHPGPGSAALQRPIAATRCRNVRSRTASGLADPVQRSTTCARPTERTRTGIPGDGAAHERGRSLEESIMAGALSESRREAPACAVAHGTTKTTLHRQQRRRWHTPRASRHP